MTLIKLYTKYKSTYYDAFKDLTIHSLVYMSTLYATWYYQDSCISLLTIPLLGLMNIRTFIIYHDCGHNSYTPSKELNYIVGSILGLFSFTPFCWTYEHHNHHLTVGNMEEELDHGYNETIIYTLKEFNNMESNKKLIYRILRDPLFFFTIFPIIKFLLIQRGSTLLYKYNNHPYKQSHNLILFDTLFSNIGVYILLTNLNNYNIIYHYLLSIIIASSVGFMLFHNQHTFNPPYVVSNNKWNKTDSGLIGSSFIKIPTYLKYFTMGIEYHHIHHMNASIPGYNLQKLHNEIIQSSSEFNNINKLSMKDCYHNLWLTLYDEDTDKYISFKEAGLKIK